MIDKRSLLMPTAVEVLLYGSISFTIVAIDQFESIVSWLTGQDASTISFGDALDSVFFERIEAFLEMLDRNELTGSIVLSLFWAGIGVVTYLLVNVLQRFFIEAEEDVIAESRYVHPKDYNHSYFWFLFAARVMFRVAMLISLGVYTFFTLHVLIPTWLQLIDGWIAEPSAVLRGMNALLAYVGLLTTWHIFVILTRLVFLRERVFDKD